MMADAAMMVLDIVLMMQCWSPSVAGNFTTHFTGVKLSHATMLTSLYLEAHQIPQGSFMILRCSAHCGRHPWCDLWCRDDSTDQCFFSNMIVTPGYKEVNMADALVCYTRRHEDFATGAAIQSTPNYPVTNLRVKENLVDGIYDLQLPKTCYNVQEEYYPWLLFDFRVPVTFRLIKMILQPKGQISILHQFTNMEIRVGMSEVVTLGDFSSYIFFGSFTGIPTEYNQEIVVEVLTPVNARFLSVQKMDLNAAFQICHIEVY